MAAAAAIGRIMPTTNGTPGFSAASHAFMMVSLRIARAAAVVCLVSACGGAHSSDLVVPRTAIGVNVNTIAYWDGSRPFENLIYGSHWQMEGPAGWEEVPPARLDANGWVKSLPTGYRAARVLSVPASSAEIVCRWQGNDHNSMRVGSDAVTSDVVRKAGSKELRFHYSSSYPKTAASAFLTFDVDPSNHVRNIDCRDAATAAAETFDPTFVGTVQGFRVVRFMKWQTAVEENRRVTWATRNKLGDGSYWMNDGVPIEEMVALANRVGADPWFAMPWNADDEYITRFATYVRDNLTPGRRVYVEVSNEVWNAGYPVQRQAQEEGAAEGLDPRYSAYGQAMYRYAEKTQRVMGIWSVVFGQQMNRLVRVASTQNVSPFWSDQILGYRNTAQFVDALATAPYWSFLDSDYNGQSVDQIMAKVLPTKISETLNWAVQQKAVARKYGKRYIAYEGGQHVWLNRNRALVGQIERDPRMIGLYASYLNRWNSSIGDTLTLFALTGPTDKAGFGLVEYAGQPLERSPKMRAVRRFMVEHGR